MVVPTVLRACKSIFVSRTHSEFSKRQVNVQDAVILQNDGLLLIKCLADDVAFLAGNDNLSNAANKGQACAHRHWASKSTDTAKLTKGHNVVVEAAGILSCNGQLIQGE